MFCFPFTKDYFRETVFLRRQYLYGAQELRILNPFTLRRHCFFVKRRGNRNIFPSFLLHLRVAREEEDTRQQFFICIYIDYMDISFLF